MYERTVDELIHLIDSSKKYSCDIPRGYECAKLLLTTIEEGGHITLDMDSDVDGLFSTLIVRDTLDFLGYKNYTIVRLHEKRHGIDGNTVDTVLSNNSKLLVITDSSSDKIGYINELCNTKKDLRIMLIDHHVPNKAERHPNILEINSHTTKTGYKDMSCGLLTYLVLKPLIEKLSMRLSKELESLAYATVISDSVNVNSDELVSFLSVAKYKNRGDIHPLLTTMMSDAQVSGLSRENIMYYVAPKINACFRTNNLKILYDTVLADSYRNRLYRGSLTPMYNIHRSTKEKVEALLTNINLEQHAPFVVADMTDACNQMNISSFEAQNYTGLISQRISTSYKEPAICVLRQGNTIKGSFRDYYGRNLLTAVSTYLNAGGHEPAFGFVDTDKAWKTFLLATLRFKDYLKTQNAEKNILVDANDFDDTTFKDYVDVYSKVNELGSSLPNIHLTLKLPYTTKINNAQKISTCSYNNTKMISYSGAIHPSVNMLWKPVEGTLVR